jgi:pimeloyl-ACP methyl ester carboxylesterase
MTHDYKRYGTTTLFAALNTLDGTVMATCMERHRQQEWLKFTQTLRLSHYALYMQDYGGPVGFRMALAHPERIDALIVQDAVAHNDGLGANWATRRAFWVDRPAHEEA